MDITQSPHPANPQSTNPTQLVPIQTGQPVTTENTGQQTKESNKKYLAIVAFVLLLVAVLGGVAYAVFYQANTNQASELLKTSTIASPPESTPQSDIETKNWSSYGDQNARYSISYPAAWHYDITTSSILSDDFVSSQDDDSVAYGARVSLQKNDKNSSSNSTFTAIPSENLSILSQRNVSVGQEEATYYVVMDLEINKKFYLVLFSDEFNSFEIKYEYEQTREQELTETFDLIIQSFRFTYKDRFSPYQRSEPVEPTAKDNVAIKQADSSIQATVTPGYVVENQFGGFFIMMQVSATSKEGNITELAIWADEDTEKKWEPYVDDFTPDSFGMSVNLATQEKGNVHVEFRDSTGNTKMVTLTKEQLEQLMQQ